MSSEISKKPLTEYGTQPYGPSISANLVCTIGQLYDKARSPVQMKRMVKNNSQSKAFLVGCFGA